MWMDGCTIAHVVNFYVLSRRGVFLISKSRCLRQFNEFCANESIPARVRLFVQDTPLDTQFAYRSFERELPVSFAVDRFT